jgi:hypothetical protein
MCNKLIDNGKGHSFGDLRKVENSALPDNI